MLFGHLVSGNLQLGIGNRQLVIGNWYFALVICILAAVNQQEKGQCNMQKDHMPMQSVCTVYFVLTDWRVLTDWSILTEWSILTDWSFFKGQSVLIDSSFSITKCLDRLEILGRTKKKHLKKFEKDVWKSFKIY